MDKYQLTQQMRLVQSDAEVDPALAEVVVAYTRLCTDRGVEPEFLASDDDARRAVADAAWFQDAFLSRNEKLPSRLAALFVGYGKELARRRVPLLFSAEDLAFQLGISMRQLNWLAYGGGERYRRHEVMKSGGKVRVIHAPTPKLKTVQKWIAERIVLKSRPHRYATAFYPGSKLVDNANPHVGRNIVVRMDLRDFFPSITFGQVRRVFASFGYTHQVSLLLANLCCHEGRLVQGAPSSPALSNLVAKGIDHRVTGVKRMLAAKEKNEGGLKFYYSRYADDLIFSSDEEEVLSVLPFVRQIVREEGFEVNEDKTRIMRAGRQQQVTGVVVNQRLNVASRKVRLLRTVLHDIKSRGVAAAMKRWDETQNQRVANAEQFQRILAGKLAFIHSVNPEKGAKLLDSLNEIVFS